MSPDMSTPCNPYREYKSCRKQTASSRTHNMDENQRSCRTKRSLEPIDAGKSGEGVTATESNISY